MKKPMSAGEINFEAQKLLGRIFEDTKGPTEQELLRTAFDALDFIRTTGMLREFESFQEKSGVDAPAHTAAPFDPENLPDPHGRGPTTTRDMILGAQQLIERIHEETPEPSNKVLLQTTLDALDFIRTTGKFREFEEYREQLFIERPAYAVAAFNTQEEAQFWLDNHPMPPEAACVLVADEYYTVADLQSIHRRALLRQHTVEFYLEEMLNEGMASTVASFKTREEAREWFNGLKEKPGQAVVEIGGERHLLAYHRNIHHLAFHPFSVMRKPKESGDAKPS